MEDKILVLDFGSTYAQDIVKKIRSLNVFCELVPHDVELDELKKSKGIILSGSNDHVYEANSRSVNPEIFNLEIPVLGICYGLQLEAQLLGGQVERMSEQENGLTPIIITKETVLTKNIESHSHFHMEHYDALTQLPTDFENCASSAKSKYALIKHQEKDIYGVQFHPEVGETSEGLQLLKNFVLDICDCKQDFTIDNFIQQQMLEIRETVKDNQVILALSGGVDSTVVAALLSKAIGKQLTCILVDHGLMRKNEIDQVQHSVLSNFDLNFEVIDAKQRFLDKLNGVTDPETKRKIIGKEFIDVFADVAKAHADARFLAQGTIYSDVIESQKKNIIKSHHNVGGLPEDLNFDLIEPLKMLFKDEVRKVGEALGLPKQFVYRQPFPGPGLGVRIVGEITQEKISLLQEADAVVREEIEQSDLNPFQYFAVITPIKTVGIKEGKRSYDYCVGIRAVESIDAMQAEIVEIPYPVLKKISKRITTEIDGINRVVYDITSKPTASIEWE